MKTQGIRLAMIVGLVSFALAGCVGDPYSAEDANMQGANSYGLGDYDGYQGGPGGRSAEERFAQRTLYFGFDRFDVSEQDYDVLSAHANYLEAHPNKNIRIDGHTDQRGSREYNIALGERRAKSVANVLMSQGVSRHQIKIVSYGQEKPAAHGSTDSAYKLNRRAELAYF